MSDNTGVKVKTALELEASQQIPDIQPVSPDVQPLEPEERARRYEELRRRTMMSRIYAKCKNPAIEVRWIRKDDPNDIALHEHWGFSVAKEPNPKAPKEKRRFDTAIPPREDGTYICGDVILYEIAKDDYDFYLNQNRATANALIEHGQRVFRDEASKLEVQTFVRDKSGRRQA